jgi:hypothetical protein
MHKEIFFEVIFIYCCPLVLPIFWFLLPWSGFPHVGGFPPYPGFALDLFFLLFLVLFGWVAGFTMLSHSKY